MVCNGVSLQSQIILFFSAEKRVVELIDKFEDLKKRGKLSKNIEKHRKKIVQKNRRKISSSKEGQGYFQQ